MVPCYFGPFDARVLQPLDKVWYKWPLDRIKLITPHMKYGKRHMAKLLPYGYEKCTAFCTKARYCRKPLPTDLIWYRSMILPPRYHDAHQDSSSGILQIEVLIRGSTTNINEHHDRIHFQTSQRYAAGMLRDRHLLGKLLWDFFYLFEDETQITLF